MSNTDSTHCSLTSINDDSEATSDSDMQKLELLEQLNIIGSSEESPGSKPVSQSTSATSAVEKISEQLSSLELLQSLPGKESQVFQKELSSPILTAICSTSAPMENYIPSDYICSSMNSVDNYKDITISDEDSYAENVDQEESTSSLLPNVPADLSQLSHYHKNIPAVTTGFETGQLEDLNCPSQPVSMFHQIILSNQLEPTPIISLANESVSTTIKTFQPSTDSTSLIDQFHHTSSTAKYLSIPIIEVVSDSCEREDYKHSNDTSKVDAERSPAAEANIITKVKDSRLCKQIAIGQIRRLFAEDGADKNAKNVSKHKKKTFGKITYLELINHNTIVVDEEHCGPRASDKDLEAITERLLKSTIDEDKENEILLPPVKAKRKLFTQNNEESESFACVQSIRSEHNSQPNRDENMKWNNGGAPGYLYTTPHSVKKILELHTLQSPASQTPAMKSAYNLIQLNAQRLIKATKKTAKNQFGFLRSLDAVYINRADCHPAALAYRDNFKETCDELTALLMQLYNEKIFNGKLDVPIKWNENLNTAGLCKNLCRMGFRSASIELSEKLVTSCDRLRCTLIHELCHAATWVLNGEVGHGPTWTAWAKKAMEVFTELPIIEPCQINKIEYKYTYQCTLCGAKSESDSKPRKVNLIRCAYCHGFIEIRLNKKEKKRNATESPVRKADGFTMFVKERYDLLKAPDDSNVKIMQTLNEEYSQLSTVK